MCIFYIEEVVFVVVAGVLVTDLLVVDLEYMECFYLGLVLPTTLLSCDTMFIGKIPISI